MISNQDSTSLKKNQEMSSESILIRGASVSLLIKIAGTGIAFFSEVFLARLMGEKDYGVYAYVITWLNVLLLFSKVGCDNLLVKYVSAYQTQKDWKKLRGIFQFSHIITIVASLIIAVITIAITFLLKETINLDLIYTFWIACLILPLLTITQVHRSIFQSLKLIALAEFPHLVLRPIILVSFIAVVYFIFHQPINSILVISFNSITTIIIFLFGIYWLNQIVPKPIHNCSAQYSSQEWFKFTLALLFMSGMSLILSQTDIIMIGSLVGTTKAGIYSVVTRASTLITFGLTAVNSIFAPMISELYVTGKFVELQKIVKLAARGIFAYSLTIGCLFVIFGNQILGVFGTSFQEGYYALIILTVGQLVNALAGSVGFLMTMTGHQKQASVVLMASALLNIILNAILIPSFGINGAAIATATTTALWNVVLLIYVRKYLKINPLII